MTVQRSLSIGPELPDFGSWNWLGTWMIDALSEMFEVSTFRDIDHTPEADILIFLKFIPSATRLAELQRRSKLIFVPVDIYGSAHEIDSDLKGLCCVDLIILHCQRLTRYFQGISDTVCMDHPLKFVLPEIRTERVEGPLLWVGKQCNLVPVIPCLTEFSRYDEIRVLTDIDQDSCPAEELGFTCPRIQIGKWSPERHIEWMSIAKAAVDVKGDDFRSRHKPPAKALDFLASGVPVITNRGSSIDLNLANRGFPLLYEDEWRSITSGEYQQNLSQHAAIARQQLSVDVCSRTLVQLVQEFVDRKCEECLTVSRMAHL